MRKISIFFILIISATILTLFFNPKKLHYIVLTDQGYRPQSIEINKGDIVNFSTNLTNDFWPASNPHPSHKLLSGFDPKKSIKSGESWSFKFIKSGNWTYHDHINPSLRGSVIVKETNPIVLIKSWLINYWNRSFVKHDQKFIDLALKNCGESPSSDRDVFEYCWGNFFSELTQDFGPKEALRILDILTKNGKLASSDCHNFADEIGIDSYWKFSAGDRFEFTEDFAICSYGFFHGFMLEHVSHGQDFEGSIRLCDSLNINSKYARKQCYVGAGSGLSYYYLSRLGGRPDGYVPTKVITESVKRCSGLKSGVDDCVYGVYGGIEHMILGVHGVSLTIDKKDPYGICLVEKNPSYSPYCYEKITRPLYSWLGFDVSKVSVYVNSIPSMKIRKSEVRSMGNLLSQFQTFENGNKVVENIKRCDQFYRLRNDCVYGVFEGLFLNLIESEKIIDFSCEKMGIKTVDTYICKMAKQELIDSIKP